MVIREGHQYSVSRGNGAVLRAQDLKTNLDKERPHESTREGACVCGIVGALPQ